jgi:hypothetical protein
VINSYIPMQATMKKILNVVGSLQDPLAIECLRGHRLLQGIRIGSG